MTDALHDIRRVWLAGSIAGLFWSHDGETWSQVGEYRFRVTSIVRKDARTYIGAGSGLWEAPGCSGWWTQLHDETLTEVLDLAWVPGDPGLVAASAYGVAVGVRGLSAASQGTPPTRWQFHTEGLCPNERFTNAIQVDPQRPRRWLVGTEAGLLVAEQDGRRWVHTSLTGTPVRAICHALGAWWAGTDGSGIWQSQDGLSWKRAGNGLDQATVFALCESKGRLLAGTLDGIVTGDGHGRWIRTGPRALVAAVDVHRQDPSFWMAGAVPGGLWVTRDAGVQWQSAPGLPNVIEAISAPMDTAEERMQ